MQYDDDDKWSTTAVYGGYGGYQWSIAKQAEINARLEKRRQELERQMEAERQELEAELQEIINARGRRVERDADARREPETMSDPSQHNMSNVGEQEKKAKKAKKAKKRSAVGSE